MIVLLPVVFYSGYEISSQSDNEKIMTKMYDKQLDVVLFSVNQYSWDAVSSWVNTIHKTLSESANRKADLDKFLEINSGLKNIWVIDSTNQIIYVGNPVEESEIIDSLNSNKGKIQRLMRFQNENYRKIEPIIFQGNLVMLVFVSGRNTCGIVLDTPEFIDKILGPRLINIAANDFVLAIGNDKSELPVFSTETVGLKELKNRKSLWIFPDHFLAVRLKGTTIEEIVESRFWKNIGLILLIDLILLIGAVLIYKTIKKELELIELKTDFVSNVSHELRTPLALIRMFSETLEMGRVKSEDKKQEYYKTIINETERLTRLVNNLLNFSRMEVNKRKFELVPINLNEKVLSILQVYQVQLKSMNFEVVTDLDEYLSFIDVDQEGIEEALHNLIDNAMKYSVKDRFIKIKTGKTEEYIYLEVQDHGIGIAKQDHQKIFEKFFRVSGGLVHTAKGSGLGLSLVQYIMNSHGGKIELESEIGKGSTFRLLFPKKK